MTESAPNAPQTHYAWEPYVVLAYIVALVVYLFLQLYFFGTTTIAVQQSLLFTNAAGERTEVYVTQPASETQMPIIGVRLDDAVVATATLATSSETITVRVTTTVATSTESRSIRGPWDSFWWRGNDRGGPDDPTPGVTKVYEIPIQGVGGGGPGEDSGDDGGSEGDDSGLGGGPPGGGGFDPN